MYRSRYSNYLPSYYGSYYPSHNNSYYGSYYDSYYDPYSYYRYSYPYLFDYYNYNDNRYRPRYNYGESNDDTSYNDDYRNRRRRRRRADSRDEPNEISTTDERTGETSRDERNDNNTTNERSEDTPRNESNGNNTRDERTERTSGERTDEVTEEDIKKVLSVEKVDLNIKENTTNHHTNKFMCTKRKDKPSCLVVRRGQPFRLTVTFDRKYLKEQHDIKVIARTGDNHLPSRGTFVTMELDEYNTNRPSKSTWKAKMTSGENSKSIEIEITPSVECIVAKWDFEIETSKQKEAGLTKSYKVGQIIILLNPWCELDRVYMEKRNDDDEDRGTEEYISNDSGGLFYGSEGNIAVTAWAYSQFKEGVIDICLHLIQKAFKKVDSKMGEPDKLARAISGIVNSNDDDGVLIGNWSGDYSGGTSPASWKNSADILAEYKSNGYKGVKYGQCWVFAAVTTTVCRAIGLPARCVTNFNSFHDADFNLTYDKVYFYNEEEDSWEEDDNSIYTNDSIWNFHAWNECWISRPDRGKGPEWQVIDATPQEPSYNGKMCLGPVPVSDIKEGELRDNQDAYFVFSEVNADLARWGYSYKDHKFKVLNIDPNHVGVSMSTTKPTGRPLDEKYTSSYYYGPDTPYRLDITDNYKYTEGTFKERAVTKKVIGNMPADAFLGRREVIFKGEEDIKIEIGRKDSGKPHIYGEPFEFIVDVMNVRKTSRGNRTIKHLQTIVKSVHYMRTASEKIFNAKERDFILRYQENKEYRYNIDFDKYHDNRLDPFSSMEITVFCYIEDTEHYATKTKEVRITHPGLNMEASKKIVKVGEIFKVKVAFKNSMPRRMRDCVLHITGSGLKNSVQQKIGDIEQHSDWSTEVELEADEDEEFSVIASLICDDLPNISGMINITAVED